MPKKVGLLPISAATLSPDARLGIDIYVRPAPGESVQLLFRKDQPVDWHFLSNVGNERRTILIDRLDRNQYQKYLRANWTRIAHDSTLPIEDRLGVMNEVVRDVMSEQLAHGVSDSMLESTKSVAEETVSLLNSNHIALQQLMNLLHHDYATFTHSANVSFFCTLLAKELGYSLDVQHEIAVGGLLHDLGKLEVPPAVLLKPGKLTKEEYNLVKRHPIIGFEKFVDRTDVSFGQLMMVYQHHERLDGHGYPCNLLDTQIHPWAKICAIADVYEAMTSDRPYRSSCTEATARRTLYSGRGSKFDPEMLDAWLQITSVREEAYVQ